MNYLRRRLGIDKDDPDPRGTYTRKLAAEIRNSRYVSKGVVLALDGVYTAQGKLDPERTCFMVSNDSVFSAAAQYDELLPGCSINPQRRDAIDELSRCRERGAVLVKVIPNTQGFDPSERRYVPFFRKMAELGIPLLTHPGYEFVLSARNQAFGDPALLRPVLDEGVDVIVAHGASTGLVVYERYFATVMEFVRSYPNIRLDLSATTVPTRAGILFKIRNAPELRGRLLFGSDYPLPSFCLPFVFSIRRREYARIKGERNYFDRLALTFNALGVDFDVHFQSRILGGAGI